jgi:hypothetical protein
MSFDLFVLVEKFDTGVQAAWVERMKQHGVDCALPDGFRLDRASASSALARCALGPPLVATAQPAVEVGVAVTSQPAADDDRDSIDSGGDPELARRVAAATIEFHFETSAGRDEESLLFQCYGAAALADVAGGVLVDPQAGSTVYGAATYAVAKANSDWALPKPAAPTSWWERLLGR